MPPEVRVVPPEGPVVEGLPELIEVSVRAPEDRALVLDSVRFEGALGGDSWRRLPAGLVLYDAQADRYAHLTSLQAVASVPLHRGVLPPRCGTTANVPARFLEAGLRSITVVVRYAEIAPAELPDRLYLSRAEVGIRANPLIFKRGREHAAEAVRTPPGNAIVRETGLEAREHRVTLEVSVGEDAQAPGRVAAVRGKILGRSTALGGAWIVAAAKGAVSVLFPEGAAVTLDAAPEVFEAFDALRGEGLRALFRGARASRVCEELLGESGELVAALVQPERLRALVELAAGAGLRLRVGRPWEGVVVEAA